MYIAMAAVIWLSITRLDSREMYSELAISGLHAEGVVDRPDCGNHGTYDYHFDVDGRRYAGRDHARVLGRSCDSVSAGQKIDVVYMAGNPAQSVGGDPRIELNEITRFAGFAALICPAFIIWQIVRRRKIET